LLAAVAGVELTAEQADPVALLALAGIQDVEPGERPGSWRIARRVARDRIISTPGQFRATVKTTGSQERSGR
jgi:poly(3-hydroxybutyrate) depolymerase